MKLSDTPGFESVDVDLPMSPSGNRESLLVSTSRTHKTSRVFRQEGGVTTSPEHMYSRAMWTSGHNVGLLNRLWMVCPGCVHERTRMIRGGVPEKTLNDPFFSLPPPYTTLHVICTGSIQRRKPDKRGERRQRGNTHTQELKALVFETRTQIPQMKYIRKSKQSRGQGWMKMGVGVGVCVGGLSNTIQHEARNDSPTQTTAHRAMSRMGVGSIKKI